mmetsp:Transcript_35350/g.69342  ORF Transcript_35350/g.69342 Transcript_35350/m.69342 type:complete len:227 (+) Transcript_35350:30-710(+)
MTFLLWCFFLVNPFIIFVVGLSFKHGFYPTYNQDCGNGTHACYPGDVLDCIWSPDQALCGQNHIWLHVDHSRLALPLYGEDTCKNRFSSLDDAKFACQQVQNCTGITQDLGISCDSKTLMYSLRTGALLDTWDTNYLSWVKKDFVLAKGQNLLELFELDDDRRCNYRHKTFEEASFSCKLLFYCTGIVLDSPLNGCPESNYELRQGGQVPDPGASTTWVFGPVTGP